MTLVDSHCHLDDSRFDADRDAAVGRALQAGVVAMLAIGTGDGPPDLEAGIRLAERYECVWATVGVHPHEAAKANGGTARRLAELLRHPKAIALGEIGLDYHYNFSPPDVQQAVFVEQLHIAREAGKPVVIHTREAWSDTVRILRDHWAPSGLPGIMHCFSGGPDEAGEALAMGFLLSFGGVITFPKATNVREAARITPAERLLVETDSPYLAPVPHRGQRNEPAFVVETAKRLASIRGITLEEVADTTTANFDNLRLPVGKPSEYTG
jgi:TatD DNase family protein